MRIMILTAGTQSLLWFRMDMMKELVKAGHSVIAVGAEAEEQWSDKFSKKDIRYRQMQVNRTGTNPFADLKTVTSTRRLLAEEQPDVLFTFHAKGNIYGTLAAHLEGLENTYASIEGLGNVLMPAPGAKNTVNPVRAIMKTEYRFALRFAKKVFFVNHENRDFFVENKLVDPQKCVITDGIGVNLKRFAEKPLPENTTPTFLFLGRLIQAKGILVFAEAARLAHMLYPDTPMRCVAIGPTDRNDKNLQTRLDYYLKNKWIDYQGNAADVRPFLEQCCSVVLPSHYNEGLPKSLMEGMATGRSIITSNTVGCRETVENGVNGFLIEPNDAASLSACLVELARNPQLQKDMGKASRALAEKRFDVQKINAQLFKEMGIPVKGETK